MLIRLSGWSRSVLLTLILAALLVMLGPAPAVEAASPIVFPDHNLAAAIRDALGMSPGEDIYQTDLDGLYGLTADGKGIHDLTGLEHCTNLGDLTLCNNQIKDIAPILGLTNLFYVDLGNNQIEDVPSLEVLPYLLWVFLGDNEIEDISGLRHLDLEILVLWNNRISDVSPLSDTWVEDLVLDNNTIADVEPLTHTGYLNFVALPGNPLSCESINTWIPAMEASGVTVFWDSVIPIPDPNLEAAIRAAIGKPTGDIMHSDLAGLGSLAANYMGIVDLSGLEYCTCLGDLDLRNNSITDISPLAGHPEMRYLDLGGNQIASIPPLPGLDTLFWLFLDHNQINDLSNLPTAIEITTLGYNQISDLTPLQSIVISPGLTLDHNLISDIAPLVNNPTYQASGSYDPALDLRENPLGATAIGAQIPTLQGRGVWVDWEPPSWDIQDNGKADYIDLAMLGAAYGTATGDPGFNAAADINHDGKVNYKDLAILGAHYGQTY